MTRVWTIETVNSGAYLSTRRMGGVGLPMGRCFVKDLFFLGGEVV